MLSKSNSAPAGASIDFKSDQPTFLTFLAKVCSSTSMSSTSVSPYDKGEAEQLVVFLFFPKDFFLNVEVERSKWRSVTTSVSSREEEGVSNATGGGTRGFYQVMAQARAFSNLPKSIFQGGMLSGELLTHEPTENKQKTY